VTLPPPQREMLHRIERFGAVYDDTLGTTPRRIMEALDNKGLVELITDEDMDLCWVLCEKKQ